MILENMSKASLANVLEIGGALLAVGGILPFSSEAAGLAAGVILRGASIMDGFAAVREGDIRGIGKLMNIAYTLNQLEVTSSLIPALPTLIPSDFGSMAK